MKSRPVILVTNDDGIDAPGIGELIQAMATIGNVVVVAPDSPQSAKGHAITLESTLQVRELQENNPAIRVFTCSGTPADCVKFGIKEVIKRKPDLCVSGINHGSNSAINIIYSGTMSAALEAGIEGVPSIGFSLLDYSWGADFSAAMPYVKKITKSVLTNGLPEGVVLNVNFPKYEKNAYQGIKITRQAKSNWNETFVKRTNPAGKEYFWLTGTFENLDTGNDTDEAALSENYVSITPVKFDFTAHNFVKELKEWEF